LLYAPLVTNVNEFPKTSGSGTGAFVAFPGDFPIGGRTGTSSGKGVD